MANRLRGLVSKKKKRYRENGFDLDLSYIRSNIIAMGFPSEGTEGVYRNNMKDVQRFFKQVHGENNCKVYNLCSERRYDAKNFNGLVGCYPFDDHNPCPFELMLVIMLDIDAWLTKDSKHVAAIHCKAGKGRTGLIISSYLVFRRMFNTPEEALKSYAEARTYNGKGVTIPSQIRYVRYFYYYCLKFYWRSMDRPLAFPFKGVPMFITGFTFSPRASFDVGGGCDPYVKVHRLDGTILYDQKKDKKNKIRNWKANEETFRIQCSVPVSGDFKVVVYDHDNFGKDDKMFAFWLHTAFISTSLIHLNKPDLDGAVKDKKCKRFPHEFRCVLEIAGFESNLEFGFDEKVHEARDHWYESNMQKKVKKSKKIKGENGEGIVSGEDSASKGSGRYAKAKSGAESDDDDEDEDEDDDDEEDGEISYSDFEDDEYPKSKSRDAAGSAGSGADSGREDEDEAIPTLQSLLAKKSKAIPTPHSRKLKDGTPSAHGNGSFKFQPTRSPPPPRSPMRSPPPPPPIFGQSPPHIPPPPEDGSPTHSGSPPPPPPPLAAAASADFDRNQALPPPPPGSPSHSPTNSDDDEDEETDMKRFEPTKPMHEEPSEGKRMIMEIIKRREEARMASGQYPNAAQLKAMTMSATSTSTSASTSTSTSPAIPGRQIFRVQRIVSMEPTGPPPPIPSDLDIRAVPLPVDGISPPADDGSGFDSSPSSPTLSPRTRPPPPPLPVQPPPQSQPQSHPHDKFMDHRPAPVVVPPTPSSLSIPLLPTPAGTATTPHRNGLPPIPLPIPKSANSLPHGQFGAFTPAKSPVPVVPKTSQYPTPRAAPPIPVSPIPSSTPSSTAAPAGTTSLESTTLIPPSASSSPKPMLSPRTPPPLPNIVSPTATRTLPAPPAIINTLPAPIVAAPLFNSPSPKPIAIAPSPNAANTIAPPPLPASVQAPLPSPAAAAPVIAIPVPVSPVAAAATIEKASTPPPLPGPLPSPASVSSVSFATPSTPVSTPASSSSLSTPSMSTTPNRSSITLPNRSSINGSLSYNNSAVSASGFYPIERLRVAVTSLPPGVSVNQREMSLSESDFQSHFKLSKAEWIKLPAWKKDQKKKDLGLF